MASIMSAVLNLTHNHTKKTVLAVATCKVQFTPYEVKEMKEGLRFKLKCSLSGNNPGPGNLLFIYPLPRFFPDQSPTPAESATYEVTLGEGVLDEDVVGADDILATFTLTNLYTKNISSKKSNLVFHFFES